MFKMPEKNLIKVLYFALLATLTKQNNNQKKTYTYK